MKLETERDVLDLLTAYLPSAALGAALELGLFWSLASEPMTLHQVADRYNIPFRRCQHWLNLLTKWGLLERQNDLYAVTLLTRTAILEKYTQETWGFLAHRELEWYPIGADLAAQLGHPGSLWTLKGRQAPSDYERIRDNHEWAARYTRMLYERTLPQAVLFAESLDMTGVSRVMDLGGGSGVISLALLRRYPELKTVVVDFENVCVTGRELADANGLGERISFHPANLAEDELPTGFDLVVESDVGIYTLELFRRVYASLNPRGRFVISQPWAEPDGTVPERLILRNFRSSLEDPSALECIFDDVRALMVKAGFRALTEWQFGTDDVVLESHKS
jgi:tRNA A58 N-methylase Trm61